MWPSTCFAKSHQLENEVFQFVVGSNSKNSNVPLFDVCRSCREIQYDVCTYYPYSRIPLLALRLVLAEFDELDDEFLKGFSQ